MHASNCYLLNLQLLAPDVLHVLIRTCMHHAGADPSCSMTSRTRRHSSCLSTRRCAPSTLAASPSSGCTCSLASSRAAFTPSRSSTHPSYPCLASGYCSRTRTARRLLTCRSRLAPVACLCTGPAAAHRHLVDTHATPCGPDETTLPLEAAPRRRRRTGHPGLGRCPGRSHRAVTGAAHEDALHPS